MNDHSTGALVLLSGGLDSSVLLRFVVQSLHHSPVQTLSYDYGQRHRRELASAAWQAKACEIESHREIDISFVGDVLKGATTLVSAGADVPDLGDLSDGELDQPPTYVPNRNMMLLSIAVAYAEAQGIQHVFYGAQAQDEYGYWDCTAEFVERVNSLLSLNRRERVTVHAPFIDKKKSELVTLGVELGVDFSRTWSCYRGGELACGTCPTCVERLNAFATAGHKDPLDYADS